MEKKYVYVNLILSMKNNSLTLYYFGRKIQ